MTEQPNTEKTQKKTNDGNTVLIVIFILIFAVLAGGCIYLFLHRPAGSGPGPLSPMEEETQNMRTGAIIDPNREVRGLWVPSVLNITFPSKQGLDADTLRAELDDIVKTARDNNLNTVCLQVRPSADALYDSDIFPTSLYLSGEQGKAADEDFDALAYLCEIAQSENEDEAIAVYAWVNPLRVTSAGQDVSVLSQDNPASEHPEWTFSYNGAVYFDAGIPYVRDLVAAGVKEICEKYPVSGIIFDDYFYPYPVSSADGSLLTVDDADTYAKYGAEYESIADFRRASVNALVKACYDAVKDVNVYLQFGIAPFGIWQNDDGTNGGSDTAGMEAYDAIYCDTLAWMEDGYLDFIAPQIYWQFSTSVARYDTLVRWWNAQCDAAGIPLWISHATYNYESWNNPGEMRNQITFARAENCYRGSLFYGYPQLKDNTLGIADEIRAVFGEDIVYYERETVSDSTDADAPLTITNPPNNSRYDEDGSFIMGQSDPDTPLYCDGEPVSRTKSGYFVLYKTLAAGENTFVFTQNGTDYPYTIWKEQYAPVTDPEPDAPETVGSETTAPETEESLLPLTAELLSPTMLTALPGGETLTVRVKANADADVTVSFAGVPTVMTETAELSGGMAEYAAEVSLSAGDAGGVNSFGCPVIQVVKDGYDEPLEISGNAEVYTLDANTVIPVTVTGDGTNLKISPNSWYYDDYIPASAGMTVSADRIADGYAQFSLAGNTAYLDAANITVTETGNPGLARLGTLGLSLSENGAETVLCIPSGVNAPVNCIKNGTSFSVTVYRAESTLENGETVSLPDNPLFTGCVITAGGTDECAYVTYTLTLLERDRFYGFAVSYANGNILITLRNPQTVDTESDRPLVGKTIVLDAGHGGGDTGALTPGSHLAQNEKDCNLAIVLEAEKKLIALGAEVILLREDDTTVDIYTRMDKIDEIAPDLMLSIHQNSMPQNTDVSHIRGVVGLYWTESGRSLADCVSTAISSSLGRLKRDTASQRLAMLRNYKFPAALIEVGFVTCPEELETLCAPGGYEKAAQAVVDGILAWYETQT